MNSFFIYIKKNRLEVIFLFIIAFLSSQRFLLPDIYQIICFIPFISAIIAFVLNKNKEANTLLIISLFTCVDIGGGGTNVELFSSTPTFIRYSIYFIILGIVFLRYRVNAKKIWIPLILFSIPILISIINILNPNIMIDNSILRRDIFVCILSFLVLTNKNKEIFIFDKKILFSFLLFYGFFEIINYLAFFSIEQYAYLNYNSTKSLMVYPLLYSIIFIRSEILNYILLFFTIIILIGYTTRMIILALFVSLILYFVTRIRFDYKILIKSSFIILSIFFLTQIFVDYAFIETIKIFGTFQEGFTAGNGYLDTIKIIDPWRFGEMQLLMDQNIFSIVFGNGFGSGLYDQKGYLDFTTFFDTAFSNKELTSGIFYNFHDFWTDYGTRFGLLFVVLILFFLIKHILLSKNNVQIFYSLLIFVLVLCQFFSTSGIILITLFYLNYLKIGQKTLKL